MVAEETESACKAAEENMVVGAVTVTGWCQLRVASSFLL